MRHRYERAVLLFARSAAGEAEHKAMPGAAPLFSLAIERVARAAKASGAELVVVGRARTPHAAASIAQRGATFSSRIRSAFEDVFALGYRHVLAVGLDAPELGLFEVEAGFGALEAGRAVLGPSTDGGAYLIGVDRAALAAFSSVRWCGPHTFEDLRARLGDVVLLGLHDDVDRSDDARRLAVAVADPILRLVLLRAAEVPFPRRASAEPLDLFTLFADDRRIRGPPSAAR